MTNIAIVEDEKEERDRIRGYIDRFCRERAVSCHVDVFSDGSSFLASYAGGYDLVFMDIELGDEKLQTISIPAVYYLTGGYNIQFENPL